MEDANIQANSPLPARKVETISFLDFYEALKAVVTGKKIFREEWENKEYYGFINKGNLSLHKPDGKTYQWIINDGDMNANDWIVL